MSAFKFNWTTCLAVIALATSLTNTASAATTGNLLTDPGWDTPLTNALGGYIPVFNGPIFNTWGAEAGAVVGAENGITPAAGNGMHRQNQTVLTASQTLQLIDVTSYAAAIDANNVTVDLSALFNVPSVLAGAVANVTVRYRDALESYIGSTASASISLDGSAATWESSSITGLPVVPGTRRIHAEVAYANASLSPNLPGYVDQADLRLTIVPEPGSCLLVVSGVVGMVSLRRNRRGRSKPSQSRVGPLSRSRSYRTVLHAVVIWCCAYSSSLAGTVTNLTVTNASSPTVFDDNPTTGIKRETQSSATLLSSNLVAPMPTLSARLAGMAAADTELPAVTQTAVITLGMQINFNVVALPTESWSICVNQTRNFALTIAADPPTNGFQSQGIVDLHSANYSVTPGGAGNLQFPTAGAEDTGLIAGFGNVDVPVNQSVGDVLSGVGPAAVQLNFQQRLWAHSFANDNPNATVLAPGQEGAVRFGMVGTLTNVSADDYPGPGGRSAAADGHFVDVKVKFVPEQSGIGLLVLGALLVVSGFGRPRTLRET